MSTGVERDVAFDLHVTLEAAGDAHVSGPYDFALDGQIRGNDGFFHIETLLLGAAGHFRRERSDVALFRRCGRGWRAAEARRGSCRRGSGSSVRIFPKRHEMAPD
jgi:hypothetical protein